MKGFSRMHLIKSVPCIHRIGMAGDCMEREFSEVNFILPAILPIEAA